MRDGLRVGGWKGWRRVRQGLVPGLVVLGVGAFAGESFAQAPELSKLLASDGEYYDEFGGKVSIDGDVIVVAAKLEDEGGTDAGAAYVYRHDGSSWVEEQKLTASDPSDYDHFGSSVSVSGDRIVVGAYQDDDAGAESGSAYVFHFNGSTWSQEVKLTASDAAAGDRFGCSVAIDGDAAVVGAYLADSGSSDRGAIYVYRRHSVFGWLEEQKVLASDGANSDWFGTSVDINGDVIASGAHLDDAAVSAWDGGSVYVFNYDGSSWNEEVRLEASDAESSDWFGYSVSLADDLLLVGAPYEDEGAANAGAAYVFRRSSGSWSEEQKLMASSAATSDYFGYTVAVDGDVAVVGAYLDDEASGDCGKVYAFEHLRGSWAEEMRYAPESPDAHDWFGYSVDVDGNRAVTGAIYDDEAASTAGAAFVLSVGEFVLTADPTSVSEGDSLTFTATYGFPGAPVLFYVAEVNGIPFYFRLLRFTFNADYQFTLPATVPPGLSGNNIGFLAFKSNAFGKVIDSNIERVDFN